MPELPEVETMVRGIRPFVTGRKIIEVRRGPSLCKPICMEPDWPDFNHLCTGRTIRGVRRLAKRVILELENSSQIVIEPRMTGLMLVADPPSQEHLRVEWRLEGNESPGSLWFWDRRGLGTVRLYGPGDLAVALGPDRLGPDALLATLTDWQTFCRRTRRPIKVALLDQTLIAGIGNLYASEMLFRSGIHPERPADSLKKGELTTLRKACLMILEEAIHYEGSTLSDGTYRNALNQNGGYQNAHRVYDREGLPCSNHCGNQVLRIVQAQRSTFYCQACQPPFPRGTGS